MPSGTAQSTPPSRISVSPVLCVIAVGPPVVVSELGRWAMPSWLGSSTASQRGLVAGLISVPRASRSVKPHGRAALQLSASDAYGPASSTGLISVAGARGEGSAAGAGAGAGTPPAASGAGGG